MDEFDVVEFGIYAFWNSADKLKGACLSLAEKEVHMLLDVTLELVAGSPQLRARPRTTHSIQSEADDIEKVGGGLVGATVER